MSALAVSVAGFLFAGSSVCALWLLIAQRRDPMRQRVLAAVSPAGQIEAIELSGTSTRVLRRWVESILTPAMRALRILPQGRTIPGLRNFGQQVTLAGLLALVALACALVWTLAAFRFLAGNSLSANLVVGGVALIVGMWLAVRGWLHWHARRWAEQITGGLVNVLDLWVLCLGSGMSFQAALVRVTEESELTNSLLREQLQLTHQAILAGASREDALRYFSRRCGDLPDVRSLVAHILHAERLGSSLAQTLRVFAKNLRFNRGQDAREWIQKLPVKLAVPLVFCILPALLVIISGPAILRIIRALSNQ